MEVTLTPVAPAILAQQDGFTPQQLDQSTGIGNGKHSRTHDAWLLFDFRHDGDFTSVTATDRSGLERFTAMPG